MDHEEAVKQSCKIEVSAWVLESLTVEQCEAVGDLALGFKADRIKLFRFGPLNHVIGSVYKTSKSIAVYDFVMDFEVSSEGDIIS